MSILKINVNYFFMVFCLLSLFFSCVTNQDAVPYLSRFDFDGDGKNDKIMYTFSGGGHCCYRISLFLSSSRITYEFPFKIDGGYVKGLDNSNPDTFYIADYDHDGLPEIFLKIQTYNDEPLAIPREWREKYQISSHYILIEYEDNGILVKDYTPAPEIKKYRPLSPRRKN